MKGGLRHRLRRWYREKRASFSSSSKTTPSSKMPSIPPNDAPQCKPADPALANSASPLLRLPGELRNRIYEYALQTDDDDGLKFDSGVRSYEGVSSDDGFDGHNIPRFIPYGFSRLDHFNELKFTCRQLYKETAGLELQVNRVHFMTHWSDKFGPGQLFLTFIRNCAATKRGYFGDISLWTSTHRQMPELSQSLEPKDIMFELAEYCRQHPHVNIGYFVPYLDTAYLWRDVVAQGLFLSLVIGGEDLRSVATIAHNSALDDMETAEFYKDANGAAVLRVSNLEFWFDISEKALGSFQRELATAPWLDARVCLELATKWIKEGI
ncbi:uncharacterized protein J4E78_001658 [Alternaria triticimaculans]|uniref:uncharacterized protein n=1 Tax=Alternaria triticimaculans TaxID=297637 RepID=UPI0020C41759|nr:uncharacterized protein J4E78_001658 [Alternaria triticimaculans]KAI4673151.1 hypothetical protein J4E78_001658 [Alternaria triticimaculans]